MSIASRITSIEGHISDIYDSVELTGVDTTDIDKNLVNVPNTLKEGYIDIINNGTDTLYNNFPKVSGEGTSLTLNNTYQAPMRNNLKGNTSQTGTPTPTSPIPVNVVSGDNEILVNGKNLWGGFTQYSNSNNGVSFTVNENGSYYANGTATATASLTVNNLKTNNVYKSLQAGTYTISKTSNKVQLQAYDVDTITLLLNVTTSNTSGSFTLANTTNVALRISVPNGTNVNDTFTIMLEKGSSASQYEPYQDNTYNIDLPVENLLNLTNEPIVSANASKTFIEPRIEIIKTNTDASAFCLFEIGNASELNGKNIKLTGQCLATSTTNGKAILGYADANGKNRTGIVSSGSLGNTNINMSMSVDGITYATKKVVLWLYADISHAGSIGDTMIYENMMVSPQTGAYTPYGTTPIELCKIGNYQDGFGKSDGSQLFDKDNVEILDAYYINGTTGELKSGGTSSVTSTYIEVEPNTTYTLTNNNTNKIVEYNSSKGFVFNNTTNLTTFTTQATTKYIRFQFLTSTKDLNIIMINKGSSALPWQPYGVGKWYLHKEIGKVVYIGDNNEGWTGPNSVTTPTNRTTVAGGYSFIKYSSNNYLSNYFIKDSATSNRIVFTGSGASSIVYMSLEDSITGIASGDSDATKLQKIKTWLSTHNVTLYYILATPTNTEITDTTLINQLEQFYQAKSKENQTNISQINNDLGFIISASALKKG